MDISQFSLSRVNLSQQIADHLEDFILSLPCGKIAEKLPGELKLAGSTTSAGAAANRNYCRSGPMRSERRRACVHDRKTIPS